jgi:Mg-chelatase subunit ChlD
VKFEGYSSFVLPWTLNNEENKDTIKQKIKSLKASGSTNIASGVEKGLFLIKNRKWKNPVVSIFLLSDG